MIQEIGGVHMSRERSWFERYGIQALLSVAVSISGWSFLSFEATQKETNAALQDLRSGQLLSNAQLLSLNGQLKDVPSLFTRMSQAEVRIDRADQDIHDLQGRKR